MKRVIFILSLIFTNFVFAGDYDKEEKILKKEFLKNFPQLEDGKKIKIKKLDVDIEDDGGVEIEIDFARGSQTNVNNYSIYAEKLSTIFKEKIESSLGDSFYLKEIELETSGIKYDKEKFRY